MFKLICNQLIIVIFAEKIVCMDKNKFPIHDFSDVHGVTMPCPRSIVQVAISDGIASGLSERDLAMHVCGALSAIMMFDNVSIGLKDGKDILIFKEEKDRHQN